jgi:hypothetical protein
MVVQLSFLPDNEQEPVVKRASVPLVKFVNGRWCWLEPGTNEYQPQPELEAALLAALARAEQRNAA